MPRERAYTYVSDVSDSEADAGPRSQSRRKRGFHPYKSSRLDPADAEAEAIEVLSNHDIPLGPKIRKMRPLIAVCGVTDRVLCAAVTYYRRGGTPLKYLLLNRHEEVALELAETIATTQDDAVSALFRPSILSAKSARVLLGRVEREYGTGGEYATAVRRAWIAKYTPRQASM